MADFPSATPGGNGAAVEDLGIFFQNDLLLNDTEASNIFTFNGDSNVTVTLPLESTVAADYVIFIENLTTKKNRTITILAQGSDTIIGVIVIGEGDSVSISVSAVGEYTVITPSATVDTDGTLSGDGTQASILSVNRTVANREIFVTNDAGNDTLSGLNMALPVKTLSQANSLVSAIIPIPAFDILTSINDQAASTYVEDVIGVAHTQYNLAGSSIRGATSLGAAFTAAEAGFLRLGTLASHNSTSSKGILVADVFNFRLEETQIICQGNEATGLEISGTSADLGVSGASISTFGTFSIGLHITHTGENTNTWNFADITMGGNDTIGILCDTVSTELITLNVNNLIPDTGVLNPIAVDLRNGRVSLHANVLGGDINVDAGTLLILYADGINDLTTITVEGTLDVWIVEGNPTVNIVGAGVVNGYIGGTYFGTAFTSAPESISTSLIEGGTVTIDTSTTIDIAAGTGRIVSINTTTGEATYTDVSWDEKLAITITELLTRSGTRIGIDINGDAVQFEVTATTQTNRDFINIAVVAHAAGIVGRIVNAAFTTRELYSQTVDLQQSLGVTRRTGLTVTPATLLTFDKTAGEISAVGAGITSDNRGQNVIAIDAETPGSFTTLLGLTNTPVAALQNSIDPANFDDGTGVIVAIGAPASQATIQYVYQSILQPGGLFVMYGQTIYATLDDAVLNASTDVVDIPELILGTSNLIARIAVRSDATDLNDAAQADILAGVKFGTGVEGGSLGSGAGGGGDFSGPSSAVQNSIVTFADTTGKVGKSASDVTVLAGVISRVTGSSPLTVFADGDITINSDDTNSVLRLHTNLAAVDISNATGNVNIEDGGGGNANFFFGRIRLRNGVDTPNFALANDADTIRGGMTWDEGGFGVIIYNGTSAGNNDNAFTVTADHSNTAKKLIVNSAEDARAHLQVGDQFSDPGFFTEDENAPAYINNLVNNGGNTPAAPESTLILSRSGVPTEAYGNIVRFDLSRYENAGTASRTQLDIRLSHAPLNPEGNDTPIIMTMKSNGDVDVTAGILSEAGIEVVKEAALLAPASNATQNITFSNQTTVYNITMTANTNFTFSNAKVGSGVVIEIDGDFVPTFPAEWNQLSNSLDFEGTLTNLVYVFCMDDTNAAEIFDYTILRRV